MEQSVNNAIAEPEGASIDPQRPLDGADLRLCLPPSMFNLNI